METFDFSLARLKHLTWNLKLRSFLDEGSRMTEAQATSARECELGRWLYSTGLASFPDILSVRQLEKVHREMHASVANVIRCQRSGNKVEAEHEFSKVAELSEKVFALLDEAERIIKASN
jgi:methyl-accepting chemotaxis protein